MNRKELQAIGLLLGVMAIALVAVHLGLILTPTPDLLLGRDSLAYHVGADDTAWCKPL